MQDAIVLFGVTGDLSRRKILPSLDNLLAQGKFSSKLEIIGLATRKLSQNEFINYVGAGKNIKKHLNYTNCNFLDPESYKILNNKLKNKQNILFYLATPPSLYRTIITNLGKIDIASRNVNKGFNNIIIEKPFGIDLRSAKELNRKILEFFSEKQIYRIDHYLGKETVQNIAAFRFSNGIFEPIWNRQYIDHIIITVAEEIGVENRGKYFEEAGIVRDIVQNHLLQILALIAMEPPSSFTANAVRDEKVKVFRSIKKIPISDTVRGQYIGYNKEINVAPDSKIETYFAARLFVENWRWAGIPFYIRTGKKLKEKKTEIVITFKRPPTRMFNALSGDMCGMPNQIIFLLQPEKSIIIKFGVKKPGPGMEMIPVDMSFNYSEYITDKTISDYQRLILDCFKGDLTLFARNDAVEECWKIIDPIEESWKKDSSNLELYKSGTWGPETFSIMNNECQEF